MFGRTLAGRLRGSLFGDHNFKMMWSAATVSAFGYYVTDIAIPLLAIDELDVTSFEAGLIRVVQQLPNLLFGLLLGVFVDRMRKKPLLVWADVIRAVVLLAIPLATLWDHLNLPLVLVVVFFIGGFNLLFDVSEGAFIPHVIPRDRLVEGNSKIEASYATAQMGGPAIGGALVSLVTAPFAILLTAITLLSSAGLIRRIRVDEPPPVVVENRSVRGDIAEGLRFVWSHRLMRPVLLTSLGHSFFGWVFLSVYVLYMKRELNLTDFQVGLVFAAGGIGALIGTLATPKLNDRFGVGPVMVAGNLMFGITGMIVPVAVLIPEVALPLVVLAEFLQYLCMLPFFLNAITLLQLQSPDAIRGRVMSSRKFLTWGVQPFGSLVGGILGGVITLPWTLVVGELGLLAVGIWLLLNPIKSMRAVPSLEVTPVEVTPDAVPA
jgi:MFS family permease